MITLGAIYNQYANAYNELMRETEKKLINQEKFIRLTRRVSTLYLHLEKAKQAYCTGIIPLA